MYTCPSCHQATLPVWKRILLGPLSIVCSKCEARVAVPNKTFFVTMGIICGGIFIPMGLILLLELFIKHLPSNLQQLLYYFFLSVPVVALLIAIIVYLRSGEYERRE